MGCRTPEPVHLRDQDRKRRESVPFGIRTLTWSAKTGLCVNGNTVKLRGGCIHHDNGILGACGFCQCRGTPHPHYEKAGYNAVRCAHNPASRALLDACDRLGMYVMDETFDGWYTPKTYHDYSRIFESAWREDLSAMIQKTITTPVWCYIPSEMKLQKRPANRACRRQNK